MKKSGSAVVKSRNYIGAARKASRYAGDGGWIGTMPDKIDLIMGGYDTAEVHSDTHTIEFFGRSRGGVPLIVNLHGLGPLESPEAVNRNYRPRKHRHKRPSGGVIDQEEFLKVLEGKYGQPLVTDFNYLKERMRDDFLHSPLNLADLSENQLARNRIGHRVDAFAGKLAEEAYQKLIGIGVKESDISKEDIPLVALGSTKWYPFQIRPMPHNRAVFHMLGIHGFERSVDHVVDLYEEGNSHLPKDAGIPQVAIYCKKDSGPTRLLAVRPE